MKELFWSFMETSIFSSKALKRTYLGYLNKVAVKKKRKFLLNTYFQNGIVLSGPFKGLKYPSLVSNGSSLLPKLIGTYEQELSPIINRISKTGYSLIIDVGSAEGYYAVGLALVKKEVKVITYDISENAQKICKEMAEINGVSDRLQVFGECDKEILNSFSDQDNGLIISDCEGFELELFDDEIVENLKKFDFLIETHDCFNPIIAATLKDIFSKTHEVISVKSNSDSYKVKNYLIPFELKFSSFDKLQMVSEERVGVTEWLFCKSR
ncbi:hypothetical protein [Algoriphagus persicinus]|uniref:hypothetical protein n=1 Tax=Algoriphagus persicinus TaxID=3108754 RepID=UPI002B3A282D|nr:hypothetical protein [Algoriphagus sp. E1-3-M2]MEB2784740.1 hypothetical protein [Algoriphagus sp. E1-3-M2]